MVASSNPKRGKLYLVGSGPGNPDLLTVAAHRLLSEAKVVVYDRLVSEAIMSIIPQQAEKIYVGKAAGKHHLPQDQINELIVKLALEGKDVIRLKGGDPYIYGRGGEEALILVENAIEVEVVPGITTAQAVSTSLGIPLTHRGLATSVRYITGVCSGTLESDMDWARLADPDTTLVVYMGLTHCEEIADRLLREGMPTELPAALVENATRPDQKFVTTTLAQLAHTARQQQFVPPTIILIGWVVGLAAELGSEQQLLQEDLRVNG